MFFYFVLEDESFDFRVERESILISLAGGDNSKHIFIFFILPKLRVVASQREREREREAGIDGGETNKKMC